MANQYAEVTDRIVAMLEAGTAPWHRPWKTGEGSVPASWRPMRIGGQPYRGINAVNLWAAAMARGYTSSTWLTFKAGQGLGAYVRKGETGELAFFAGRQTKTKQDANGNDVEESFNFLKAYHVFNVCQFEDLPEDMVQPGAAPVSNEDRDARAETFIRATGATIRHGGDKAFYMPSLDCVQMPAFAAFAEPAGYYSTMLHELNHWAGAEKRCNRNLSGRFGDSAYAAEELIAELGAAFLCADLGISAEPRADHASYIATWIQVLKNDPRAIFRASALAEKSAGYLHGLQDDDGAELLAIAA